MITALVTGGAGFIGSHLCARLLDEGHRVRAIDNFDPYYDRVLKEENLAGLLGNDAFEFNEADLRDLSAAELLKGVDWVFHQAARAGVRSSWGRDFIAYANANILGTQHLLEAARVCPVERLVYASSSSVYGEAGEEVVTEDTPRRPLSPYGVTKLAAEDLASAYHRVFGIPVISLRYFTVFGPRQRPDMAFRRFTRAILMGEPLPLFGDGEQRRDFTYVADAVEANLQAALSGRPGRIYNIGGGAPATVRTVIGLIEELSGRRALIDQQPAQPGDPRTTAADTTRAREELGFEPRVSLRDGLLEMITWMRARLDGEDERAPRA